MPLALAAHPKEVYSEMDDFREAVQKTSALSFDAQYEGFELCGDKPGWERRVTPEVVRGCPDQRPAGSSYQWQDKYWTEPHFPYQ